MASAAGFTSVGGKALSSSPKHVGGDTTLHVEYRFAKEKYVMDADKMLNDLPTDRDLTKMPVPWSPTSWLTQEYFMCVLRA